MSINAWVQRHYVRGTKALRPYTIRVRGHEGTKALVFRGTRERGNEGTRERGYEVTRVRGYEGTRVRGYEGTRVRGYEGTRVRGYERALYSSIPERSILLSQSSPSVPEFDWGLAYLHFFFE